MLIVDNYNSITTNNFFSLTSIQNTFEISKVQVGLQIGSH